MSAKSKTGLHETPITKATPATPRINKPRSFSKSDADSPSPLQNSRFSLGRSPRSTPSKPTPDRQSPKVGTPPDKKTTRILKPSELQAELTLAQEDLKKSKDKLIVLEKEKLKYLDELKEAHKSAEEANEKLKEALLALKRAEEDSEIEKFRAVELEQVGLEEAQKKEEEWAKELETVRNQHAIDVSALLSTTEELQKVKQELAMTCDAKNQALRHADDATKIAEAQAEKVAALSSELAHMKTLLDSRNEMEETEKNKFISELKMEIDSLRNELENAKILEEKLLEKEATLEQLNVDLEAAKMAESYARNLVDELHERINELSSRAEQAQRLERSASESLESVMKQLERSNDSLHDTESEIAALNEKVVLLEISIERQKGDLEESECRLEQAQREASEMAKKVEILTSELEIANEEKAQSLNSEKLAASSVETLLEEKNKLINDLEASKDEEEKSKKALESLASALHEVSSEARDTKEKLLSSQAEHENYEAQIEDLKQVLKSTNDKYESMVDDAKHEIGVLDNLLKESKDDCLNLKAEWENKELQLINSLKKSEEQNSSMENEIGRLVNLLKTSEEEAAATREEEDHWRKSCKEAESEATYLKEVLGEAKAESMKLKESLMDRENELQNAMLENEELRKREAASLEKVEELSKLLKDATAVKQVEENHDLTDSEKDYDMLPKVVEFSEQNGTGDVKQTVPVKEKLVDDSFAFKVETVEKTNVFEHLDAKPHENDKEKDVNNESKEVDLKMWESCKVEEKDLFPEEEETIEDEVDSKAEGNRLSSARESIDTGATTSPSKDGSSQKKKKPLLRKFGSLLKKKGSK